MIPEELFKRRHRGTPESFTLIIVNAIVLALVAPGFVKCHHISLVFWIVAGALAIYNFFTVRRHIESFDRFAMIAYIASLVIMAGAVVALAFKDC
ncbi:hypothetical protein [Mucilaginibacter ginkgonis]|uniref:Uncharacterized protein n=1 Tax=Mucilaginibacter ginkgonis TaxID=2682091 RepID=A0A6I4INL8_9SPHI|nr:hypothetical protein [Mucilaginibacter ginkgonis]QQL48826.1 hypothetical protein GO620_011620 [Mucilaginibacter ginkgonis]